MAHLVKRNENYPIMGSVLNDIFGYDWNDWSLSNYSAPSSTLPSVNVKEDEDGFEVQMAAPGMDKADFKIEVNNGILTISSEKKVETETESDKRHKYTRKEFCYESFQRTFSLPTSADSDKIEAKYESGILSVSIPKKEESKPKALRTIEIK